MSAEAALAQALTKALHETETSGGWWGHPECEEFGRLIAPRLIRAGYHCNTDWPCDNYKAPHTCLTAPSSKAIRCDFCRAQAQAVASDLVQTVVRRWQGGTGHTDNNKWVSIADLKVIAQDVPHGGHA